MKTIDAQNKSLGRVATEAAMTLMGKDKPDYEPNRITGEEVHITNASKVVFADKKLKEKQYKRYTGYPGGLRHTSLKKMLDDKGYEEVFKIAVRGMLPDNRLRKERLKMLKITN